LAFAGTLLAESLHQETPLDAVPLRVRRIWRADSGDPDAGQPLTWTLIAFDIPDDAAEALAESLARTLEPGPWYCDYRSDHETFVVFADRIFRYPRGDRSGRDDAERHARSVGVPAAQLDWPL
jgi:hypothetical protein